MGDLTFTYEGLEVTEDPGLQLLIYTVQPGTDSAERLALLGSWAASQSWAPASALDHTGRQGSHAD